MNISEQQFQAYVDQGYNRIPLIQEIITDLETPLSLYLKLANAPHTYLFESVQGGEKWGRYSFIGLPCKTVLRIKNGHITLRHDGELHEEFNTDDPLSWIADYQKRFRVPGMENLMLFNGGLVGYFGYDTIGYIEPKLANNPLPDPLDNPDILLMVSDEFIIFDTLRNKSFLVVFAGPEGYHVAVKKMQDWVEKIRTNQIPAHHLQPKVPTTQEFQSNYSKEEYKNKIARAKEYLVNGDAMQIQFGQRLSRPFLEDAFDFYRALRTINPSPYLFYLNLGDFYIVGSSPEILVRLENTNVTLRPIAGTRPRGLTLEQDLQLEKELLGDPKELAEHLMLIDLGRNDVGRISETGSVKVTEQMVIERYSHVMHIVSNVTGKLKQDLSAVDVLRATFPAGTLTGTPKVRAMEIIAELENVRRGIYGGGIGYLAWNGNMDLAISIRTAIIKKKMIYVQASGGIVVDSLPESEWQETINKAKALLKAADLNIF